MLLALLADANALGAMAQPESVSSMLAALPFSIEDGQAQVQGPSPCISYRTGSEYNSVGYMDRAGFEGYSLTYAEETRGMAELEQVEADGLELCSTLYTYRSIARALPTVSGDDQHKRAMYAASFEVQPHRGLPRRPASWYSEVALCALGVTGAPSTCVARQEAHVLQR